MEVKRLDWDSRFFGIEVFGVTMPAGDTGQHIGQTIRLLKESKAALAYFFLPGEDAATQEILVTNGAVLYDEKITYGKELGAPPPPAPPGIHIYQGAETQQLLDLSLLAGHESRFKKDPRLTPYFEPMYKLWLVNSLNGNMADCVFVYRSGQEIEGMVTCKLKPDGSGTIGLIATSTASRGTGIGSRLLQSSEAWFINNRATRSTVVTQGSNSGACRFYEKAGFRKDKTEYVYHLWFN